MPVAFQPGSYSVQPTQFNYVSLYDVIKPDKDPDIVMRWGDQYITELVRLIGREVSCSNIIYQHYEDTLIMPKVQLDAFAGGAPSGTLTLASTTPTQNIGWSQTSPYIGTALTGQGVPVRVNDVLQIPPSAGTLVTAANYVLAQVVSVNASAGTFNVMTVDGSNIPVIAQDAQIIIITNQHGEGSNQPLSMDQRLDQYTNNVQIIKDTYEYTGTMENVVMWYDDYKSRWFPKGEENALKRVMNYTEMALIFNDHITNTTLANQYGSTPNKATKGLIPEILDNGIVYSYNPVNGFALTDAYDLTEEIDAQIGAQENFMFEGIKMSSSYDQNLVDTFKAGAISYASFGDGGEDVAIKLNFKSVNVNNYMLHKKIYKPFNNPSLMGTTGYTWNQEAFFIPGDAQMDKKSNEMISSFRVRTLRAMKSTVVDLFKTGDDGQDKTQCRYVRELGAEVMGAGRFGYIQIQ